MLSFFNLFILGIQEKIAQNFFVECPREDCLQEISSYHRLTPYKPMRLKIKEYLSNNNQAPSTFPSSLFADQLKPKETSNIVSPVNFDNKLPASKEKPSPPATSSVKINISSNKIITTIKGSSSLNTLKKQANESPEKQTTTSPVYDDLIDANPIDDSSKPKLEDAPIKEETNKAEPDINNKSPLSMVSEDRKSRSRSISSVSSSSSRSSSSASNKSVKTGESGISKVSSALSEETAKINEKSSPKSRSKSSNSSVSSRSVSRSPSRSTPSLKDEKLNDQPTNTNISADNSAVSASTNPAFAPGAELNPSFQQNYFYNNNANPMGYYNQPPKQFPQIPPPTVMPPNGMYPQGPIEPFYNQHMYPANNRLLEININTIIFVLNRFYFYDFINLNNNNNNFQCIISIRLCSCCSFYRFLNCLLCKKINIEFSTFKNKSNDNFYDYYGLVLIKIVMSLPLFKKKIQFFFIDLFRRLN